MSLEDWYNPYREIIDRYNIPNLPLSAYEKHTFNMDIEALKKEIVDFDQEISTKQKEIVKLENDIYWIKKRKKVVLQQMEETPEPSAETLVDISKNLK